MYKLICLSTLIISAAAYADFYNDPNYPARGTFYEQSPTSFDNQYQPQPQQYYQGQPTRTYRNIEVQTYQQNYRPTTGTYSDYPASRTSSSYNTTTYPAPSSSAYDSNLQNGQRTGSAFNDQFATEKDRKLAEAIRSSIKSGWFSRGFDNVSIAVNNGDVTLRGTVEKPEDIEKLQVSVRNVDGVRSVRSQLSVRGGGFGPNQRNLPAQSSQSAYDTYR